MQAVSDAPHDSESKGSELPSYPDAKIPKKLCCGAIKRLKEKCLRFHNSDENKCAEFIKGHEECKVAKRTFEVRIQNELSGRISDHLS